MRTLLTLLSLVAAATGAADDLQSALERSRELVVERRYQEVLDLLSAFDDLDDPEARYAVAAERGRAHFHLGDYRAADACFRDAVRLRPQRTETALYLMATSYLLGDREQSLLILRELLRSGATDLYLAVTLPGERAFLADPEVWRVLDEGALPLAVDRQAGAVLGVRLGQTRAEVESALGATGGSPGTAVTARAGPYLIWAFGFDDSDRLSHIMLHNEHLVRYTPYRLDLGAGLDWKAIPEAATSLLGAPRETRGAEDEAIVMTWHDGPIRTSLEFAPPRPPAPSPLDREKPHLRVVRLELVPAGGGGPGP